MAKIEVSSAFVEDVLTGDRGVWALKTSEPHSRKNDRDEWETTSRTFRTVRVSNDSGISLEQFVKGDRITFTGAEKTDVREHNGKKYYDLLVWADSISLANGRQGGAGRAQAADPAQGDGWVGSEPQAAAWPSAAPGSETPF